MDAPAGGWPGVEFALSFIAQLPDSAGAFPKASFQLCDGLFRPTWLTKSSIIESAEELEPAGIPAVTVDDGIEAGPGGACEDHRPGDARGIHHLYPLIDVCIGLRIGITVQIGHGPGGARHYR